MTLANILTNEIKKDKSVIKYSLLMLKCSVRQNMVGYCLILRIWRADSAFSRQKRVKAVLTDYVAKVNTVGFSKRLDDKMKASSLHSKQGLFAS